jgi:hypothetical protein
VLLRAFLRPDLELIAALRTGGRVRFCWCMGRAYIQPGTAVAGFMDQQFQPVAARLSRCWNAPFRTWTGPSCRRGCGWSSGW